MAFVGVQHGSNGKDGEKQSGVALWGEDSSLTHRWRRGSEEGNRGLWLLLRMLGVLVA
jgi:hypothetical protein